MAKKKQKPEKYLTADEVLKLYDEFSSESANLSTQATELKPKLARLEAKFTRLREDRNIQVALEEHEKAGILNKELAVRTADIHVSKRQGACLDSRVGHG